MKIRRIEADYVALGIIALCLVLIGLNEWLNPVKVIERAVNKSVCEYMDRETANSPFLDSDAFDMAESQNATISGSLNVDDGEYKGVGVNFSVDRNAASNIAQANANLNFNGADLIGLKAFADNKNIVVSAPALYDKNFTIDIDTFSKKLYDISNIKYDENQPQNIFLDTKAQNNTYNVAYSGISKGLLNSERKAWRSISNNVELSKLSKEELKDHSKGYMITLRAEDLKTFYSTFGEELFNNADFKKGITAYVENEFNSNPYAYMMYGIGDAQTLSEVMIQSLQSIYNNITMGAEPGDLTILVYIDGGRLTSSQITTFFTAQDSEGKTQQLDINFNADLTGEINPVDILTLRFSALSQGVGYDAVFSDTNSVEDNKYTTAKSFTIDNTINEIQLLANTTYDKKDNSYSFTASMISDEDEAMSFKSNGTVVSDKNNYEINADSLNVTMRGENYLSATANYKVSPLENKIEPIEGESVDIANAEEEELMNIITEIQGKLDTALAKIQGK